MKKLFPCLRHVNAAACVTLAGFLCGLTALVLRFSGNARSFYLFMTLAALLDMADGLVARKLHQCSPAGEMFDSLADMSSFVVVPALIFCYYGRFAPLWCAAALFYAMCGMLRLVAFTVDSQPAPGVFVGVASPWASSIMLGLCIILFDIYKLPLGGTLSALMPLWCAGAAISMVLGCIRLKKVGIFSVCVVTGGVALMVWSMIAA